MEVFVASYGELATLVEPAALATPIARDPDDDHVIASALAAGADFIVTGDTDLLVLEKAGNVRIVRVAEMLAMLAMLA